MKKLALQVTKRELLGKKLKKLRREGLVPGNIYGPGFTSTSVTSNLKEFLKVYAQAHETQVVQLELDKKEIPVLIKSLQRHPVSDQLLHVDFRKIDLTQKILTDVPVKVINESVAVKEKGGVLLLQSDALSVEALPGDIPSSIEVDISTIKEIGGEIKVSDLSKSAKFEFKTPLDKVVVSVVAHKEESVTPDTVSAAPEITTEAPVAEGEEAPVAEGGVAKAPQAEKSGQKQPEGKSESPAPKK